MAHDCPKNANQNSSSNAHKTTVKNKNSESPPKPLPTNPTLPTQLTRAQQIHTLEADMEEEEQAVYLDTRDMGLDFWSAGALRSTAPQQQ